ncbi:MAG TPA: metallophosphoesterase family protein [Thermoleophilaceae bacterium]|nr:metallophosphoesterase family protein [Thermoleophilaceae bacterium]
MSSHPSDSNHPPGTQPARIAILSDVHGNLPAFETALADARAADVDAIWCLGDLVGYGASPDECVALAQAECDVLLGGNHDLAVAGRIALTDFSPAAAAAARWTREHASPDTLAVLETLDPYRENGRIGLYHGSPTDPIWEYVLSTDQADSCFDAMGPRVGAIGHTHVALRFTRTDDGEVIGEQTPGGTEHDLGGDDWLVNPGSVGQPRDRDPRAAWLLIDLDGWTASWRRVEYPIEVAAQAIAATDLPRHLADRLFIGQ